MVRTHGAGLLLATAGLVLAVTASGAHAKSATGFVPVKVATATSAAPEMVAVAPVAAAPVSATEVVPACARRVKVIYSGYGEAARASCDFSSATATR